MLEQMNNELLLEVYKDAVKMKLDEEFIYILEKEIKNRNILDNPVYKAFLDDVIIHSLN